MFSPSERKTIETAYALARNRLLEAREPTGEWRGKLSASAVSTAVGALALSLHPEDHDRLGRVIAWLSENRNADGGWGDTPTSPSNLSAVLLVRAALIHSRQQSESVAAALKSSKTWLEQNVAGTEGHHLFSRILSTYGTDLTFSAPILTVSLLASSFGEEATLWKRIPTLPFEAALIPDRFFRVLHLPVVSYAIPALIAVGIAQAVNNPWLNPWVKRLRILAVKPALRKLRRLVPTGGGFLEAAPLTGFVAFCLGKSGFKDHPIVKAGLGFLRRTIREDGSWPIDTDLSNWLTGLAVKALRFDDTFLRQERLTLTSRLHETQTKTVNVFTRARPGGWSWTDLSGGVPDADDTACALNALSLINTRESADRTVVNGISWLLNLMNRDGGIPTFCPGWGYLPFDRSCPDISAHALAAFQRWSGRVPDRLNRSLAQAIEAIRRYLEISRDADGVWTPLWFGDQEAPHHTNRVYGTAVVLEALALLPRQHVEHLVSPALAWLKTACNPDGGFGGEPGTSSKVETTARVITALAELHPKNPDIRFPTLFLCESLIRNGGKPHPKPIGLYFASLWYEEELYPLIFSTEALGAVLKTLPPEDSHAAAL
jgi:squalene-hopene/tetraprenyl-beta-curcumene cyclase